MQKNYQKNSKGTICREKTKGSKSSKRTKERRDKNTKK